MPARIQRSQRACYRFLAHLSIIDYPLGLKALLLAYTLEMLCRVPPRFTRFRVHCAYTYVVIYIIYIHRHTRVCMYATCIAFTATSYFDIPDRISEQMMHPKTGQQFRHLAVISCQVAKKVKGGGFP